MRHATMSNDPPKNTLLSSALAMIATAILVVWLTGCMSTPLGLSAKTTNRVTLTDSANGDLGIEVSNSQGPGATEGAVQAVEIEQEAPDGTRYVLRVGVDRQSDTSAQADAMVATHAESIRAATQALNKALDLVPGIVGGNTGNDGANSPDNSPDKTDILIQLFREWLAAQAARVGE